MVSSLLVDFDADTGRNGLTHITDSKASERGELFCGFDDEGLGGPDLDDGVVTVLEEAEILELLSGALGGNNLGNLAGNLSGVDVEDRSVSDSDDGGVVQHDNLSGELLGNNRGVVDGSGNVSPLDVVLCDTADVESDVVSGNCLGHLLVVHLNGLNLTGLVGRHEDDLVLGLEDTSLDTSDRNGSDTGDGVHILNGEPERLLGVLLGNGKVVESLNQGGTLVPGGVGGRGLDVVAHVSGDGDEGDVLDLVSDHLQELGHSLDALFVLGFVVLDCIHLVDRNDDLLDTESGGKEDVLFGLSLRTLDGAAGDDGGVGLGGTGDHVLDEVTVSGGVDDGEVVLVGVEPLVGNIDSNSPLPLFLESIHDPSEVEGSLSFLFGFFLVFLHNVGVDGTALKENPSGEGGFSVVDVPDDDKIQVLFLCHFNLSFLR